jgi:putative RNA 2'-phosphotransferase
MATDLIVRTSKLLAWMLRHAPAEAGITLDAQGWSSVEDVLAALGRRGIRVDRDLLGRVVAENSKKRYALSEDGVRIRAVQGHSVDVDLGYLPCEPPVLLYHGTATRLLDAIRTEGLRPMARTHVHLAADRETATTVGARHGRPVVLTVRAQAMHLVGLPFYLASNGVWLTEHVPPEYLVEGS